MKLVHSSLVYLSFMPLIHLSDLASSQEHGWLSLDNRQILLGAILPSSVLLLTLIYDLLSTIQCVKGFDITKVALLSPFQNFLKLEDLEGPLGDTISVPPWKTRALVVASAVESGRWLTFFVYAIVTHRTISTIPALLGS